MNGLSTWRVGSLLGLAFTILGACSSDDGPALSPDAGAPKDDAALRADATGAPDTGPAADGGGDATTVSPTACLRKGLVNAAVLFPDYDRLKPVMNASCTGTKYQNITGVQKVVFLGDSITVGTPPTLPAEYYRTRLEAKLRTAFGADLEVASCAKFGARTDDFIGGGDQIAQCFPGGTEAKKTLVIFTMGGNDVGSWAKDALSTADTITKANAAVKLLRDAIVWLKDPVHFPNGSYVVFANAYEFTDGTGKVTSCAAARLSGFNKDWPEGIPAVLHFLEEYMKVAVDTRTDMMFLFEQFCGHGYKSDDPTAPCYRGPNTERWFDVTCYHPNAKGHEKLADAFFSVIQ